MNHFKDTPYNQGETYDHFNRYNLLVQKTYVGKATFQKMENAMHTDLPLTSIMTRDVTTVQRNQRPSTVRAIFAEGGFHHLPVLHDRRLVGIISASDLLKIDFSIYGVSEGVLDATLDRELTVADLMHTDPVTVSVETPVREAAQKLTSGAFHSLPVVDDRHELVGIVTSTDLIRILLESYEPAI